MQRFTKDKIPEIARKTIKHILKTKTKKAKVVALSGDLGSGKTTLTKEIAKQFGIKENIVSPTFVIMKFYDINKNSIYFKHFKKLIHIDTYRLENSEDLFKINWLEIVSNRDNLIIIEWPEIMEKYLDREVLWFSLKHIDDQTRTIEIMNK